jgi:hypothetical protein
MKALFYFYSARFLQYPALPEYPDSTITLLQYDQHYPEEQSFLSAAQSLPCPAGSSLHSSLPLGIIVIAHCPVISSFHA